LAARFTLFPYTTLFRSKIQKFHRIPSLPLPTAYENSLCIPAYRTLHDVYPKVKDIPLILFRTFYKILKDPSICLPLHLSMGLLRSEEHTSELQSRENLV